MDAIKAEIIDASEPPSVEVSETTEFRTRVLCNRMCSLMFSFLGLY